MNTIIPDSDLGRIEKMESTITYVQLAFMSVYAIAFIALLGTLQAFLLDDPYSQRHGCFWSPSFKDEIDYFLYDNKILMSFITPALFGFGIGLQAYNNKLLAKLTGFKMALLEQAKAQQKEQQAKCELMRDYKKEFLNDLISVFKKHNVVMEVYDEYDGHDSVCGRKVEIKSRNLDEEPRKVICIDDIEKLSNDVNSYQWAN